MRIVPALLLALLSVPCHAVVVVHNNSDSDSDWWKEGAKAPWSFGVLDEDGDGTVSAAEIAKAHDQYFAALKESRSSLLAASDVDNSGKLSRYEAQEARPRFNALRDRAKALALAIHDTDHDGKLSEAERQRLVQVLAQTFVQNGTTRVDADKDRKLTDAEVMQAIASIVEGKGALFTLCDRNNDGQVSPQETKLAFDLLAVCAGIRPLP